MYTFFQNVWISKSQDDSYAVVKIYKAARFYAQLAQVRSPLYVKILSIKIKVYLESYSWILSHLLSFCIFFLSVWLQIDPFKKEIDSCTHYSLESISIAVEQPGNVTNCRHEEYISNVTCPSWFKIKMACLLVVVAVREIFFKLVCCWHHGRRNPTLILYMNAKS